MDCSDEIEADSIPVWHIKIISKKESQIHLVRKNHRGEKINEMGLQRANVNDLKGKEFTLKQWLGWVQFNKSV